MMKKLIILFKISIEKSFIELTRYRFNTVSDILSFYFLFLAMFLGLKSFGNSMYVNPLSIGETLEGFVAGYFLWTVMLMAYSDTAHSVINDANRGTLEQISMSDLGLQSVLIVRSITNLAVNLIVCFLVLFSIMITTNNWLDVKLLQLIILIMIGIFSILGIALIFGGLALIFKKIQSLLSIVQYFMIGLLLPSSSSLKAFAVILPFRPAIDEFYAITIGHQSLFDISFYDLASIVVNSAIYFLLGILVFNFCSKQARKMGLLGQY